MRRSPPLHTRVTDVDQALVMPYIVALVLIVVLAILVLLTPVLAETRRRQASRLQETGPIVRLGRRRGTVRTH